MDMRDKYLLELNSFVEGIDKEVTMILQSLQWDRKHLLEGTAMVTCKHNPNHRIPPDKRDIHEKECFLICHGYSKEMSLLPDPMDANAKTLVKLNNEEIMQIINTASSFNPSFKRGEGCQGTAPLSADRLKVTYTADERRAIHDAVVDAVPSCHDLTDLALPSSSEEQKDSKVKCRSEILAELRDMKRRRAKYRVAAKTRNYSDVLRDVIKTQMEHFTEVKTEELVKTIKQEMIYTDNNEERNVRIKNIPCIDNKEGYRKDKREHSDTSREIKREESSEVYKERSYTKTRDRYAYIKEDPGRSGERSRYNENKSKNEKYYKYERHDRYKMEKSSSSKDRSRRSEADRYYREKNSDNTTEKSREVKYKRYYDGHKQEDVSEDDRRKRKKYS